MINLKTLFTDCLNFLRPEPTVKVVTQTVPVTVYTPVEAVQRFKPFFVHYNPHRGHAHQPKGAYNGFTAYIEPGDHWHDLKIRFTLCGRKDVFCKKTGRSECLKKEAKTINARNICVELLELKFKCDYKTYRMSLHKNESLGMAWFGYLYKYIV